MNEQDFLEGFVKSIVDVPEEVRVERQQDDMGVLITLYVAKQDMGKVIGKNGGTANAIRMLLRVLGAKNKARINLRINDPDFEKHAPKDYRYSHDDAINDFKGM